MEAKTRAGDSPEVAARIEEARSQGRKRTIFLSIMAAGAVALFIGRISEVSAQNDQVSRNRINCNFTQDDRKDRVDTLLEAAGASGQQADNTLGNKKPLVYKPPKKGESYGKLVVAKKAIPTADFSKPPYKAFADFKALIIIQAQQQRAAQVRNIARASKVKERLEDCNKVFPKRKTFWIV